MSPITLIIRPYRSPTSGKRIHGTFEARLDSNLICISPQPLLDTTGQPDERLRDGGRS